MIANEKPVSDPASSSRPRLFLYVSPFEATLEPELARAYLSLLSPPEAARNARFATPELRRRDLQARALVRCALSLHAASAPADWQFTESAYGKPMIASPHRELVQWQFNLSHSERVAVMAICKGYVVGVDVESGAATDELLNSPLIFSPLERASLRRLPLAERGRRFLEHWTIKEAYLKARGLGLSIPPHTFALNLDEPGRISFPENPGGQSLEAGWVFQEFDAGEYGIVSVCIEGTAAPLTELALFAPLRSRPLKLDWRLVRS
jgi:4'-phosphopantetheinyl transferase